MMRALLWVVISLLLACSPEDKDELLPSLPEDPPEAFSPYKALLSTPWCNNEVGKDKTTQWRLAFDEEQKVLSEIYLLNDETLEREELLQKDLATWSLEKLLLRVWYGPYERRYDIDFKRSDSEIFLVATNSMQKYVGMVFEPCD